ncbi:MAG: diguanylate cyclase [Treponema sp.]|nr:diguanylate cyclase [Candidatus Treponema merdequi]
MKRVFRLFSFIFLSFAFTTFAQTVKAGYLTEGAALSSYSQKNKIRNGYSYDYIQTLASYTGWNIEYVYGTYKELYSKLENGQIDILPEVSYTDEKCGYILFPQDKMADVGYYLYKRPDDTTISGSNFQSLENKKIGIYADSPVKDELNIFLTLNNLHTEVKAYDSNEKMYDDFENSRISAIVHPNITAKPDWIPISYISSLEVYLAVNKNRPDILNQIEIAFNEIRNFNPDFFMELWSRHNLQTGKNKQFTDLENDFFISHPVLKIGYLDNDLPFSNKNETTFKAEGFVTDFIELISSKLKTQKVVPQFISFSSYNDMINSLKKEEIDVIFPIVNNYYEGEIQGFFPTDTVIRTPIDLLYKNNLDTNWKESIAVSSSNIEDSFIYEIIPDAQIHYYKNRDTCISAVLQETEKVTIINSYKLTSMLYKNKKYKDLKHIQLPQECNLSFGIKRDNLVLLSIFNKLISTISENEANQILAVHAAKALQFTVQDFINSYFWIIVFICVIFFALCASLLLAVTKIKDYINFDALTHLLNRKTLQSCYNSSKRNSEKSNSAFCIMIMDLDDFKKVNDTYGHACGDEVLKTVARIITHGISSNDYAFRWGGEEILVIFNTTPNNAYNAAERIRHTIENNILIYKNEEIKITATMGFAVYRPGITWQELFATADDNLYKGKQSGKNQIVL